MSGKRLPTEPPESYPLPWYASIEWDDLNDTDDRLVVRSKDHKLIADLNDETDGALGDYIVTAANGYPVLLEAVREALDLRGCPAHRSTAVLQDALDKIGGES